MNDSLFFLKEFRGTPAMARAVAEAAEKAGRPLSFMEVCGTHTVAIARSGIRTVIPPSIKLLSGPGCPVCVTPQNEIDRIISIARSDGVIICSFGDMLKVPGSSGCLDSVRQNGGDVRVVYSPADAVEIARANPGRKTVFIGAGFETTAPAIALSALSAMQDGVDNFFVYCMLKTVPPALHAVIRDKRCSLDGFILPGHVCAITGEKPFGFLSSEYRLPSVITGFEPPDILRAIHLLAADAASGSCGLHNEYTRVVRRDGNVTAAAVMSEVFEPCSCEWRGFGEISGSGLAFRAKYRKLDAVSLFEIPLGESAVPDGCICADVVGGRALPSECPLFRGVCSPASPVGPCMVSSEGACAASFYYGE